MNLEDYWNDSLQRIINPITTQSFSLLSTEGSQLLKELINSYNYYKQKKQQKKKKRKKKKQKKF